MNVSPRSCIYGGRLGALHKVFSSTSWTSSIGSGLDSLVAHLDRSESTSHPWFMCRPNWKQYLGTVSHHGNILIDLLLPCIAKTKHFIYLRIFFIMNKRAQISITAQWGWNLYNLRNQFSCVWFSKLYNHHLNAGASTQTLDTIHHVGLL